MKKVLVIEDDVSFRSFVESTLTSLGYSVITAEDGESGIDKAVLHTPDAVLLDLKLPGINGKEVCLCLKSNPRTNRIPVIILTGEKEICDEAEGLRIGAEDYIDKPFEIRVMKERLNKAIERGHAFAKQADAPSTHNDTIIVGKIALSLLRPSVSIDGQETHLTPTEFKMLTILMKNEGRLISKDQLINEVWSNNTGDMNRLADRHITTIRKKFGNHQDYLQTLYGTGYCFKQPT